MHWLHQDWHIFERTSFGGQCEAAGGAIFDHGLIPAPMPEEEPPPQQSFPTDNLACYELRREDYK